MDTEKSKESVSRMRQGVLAVAKLTVSVGLVWYLFSHHDFSSVIGVASAIDRWWLLFSAIAITVSALLAAWRWHRILSAMGGLIGFWPSVRLVYIGLFFNQALPSNIGGDAARIWYLHRHQIPLRIAASSVVLDRVLALAALAVIALPFLVSGALGPHQAQTASVLAALCIMILAGFFALLYFNYFIRLFRSLLPQKLKDVGDNFASDFRAIAARPADAILIIISAILTQLAATLALAFLAIGLGIGAHWADWLLIGPCAILASVIPLSFAGWGVREGTLVAVLALFGIGAEPALALSVAFGLLVLAGTLPGCPFWLIWRNQRRKNEDHG